MISCVALIPARSGSKRVVNKNIRKLSGHPLLAYTINAARDSGVYDAIVCSTDSKQYADIASNYGAEVPFLRASVIAGDCSPDIEWVKDILAYLKGQGRSYDCFSILRPTSPFRQAETIKRAWKQFCATEGVDSLRAVELCSQHPGKMWVVRHDRMLPLLSYGPVEQPWHSSQYASLPEVYIQNASLEIAWTRVVEETNTIAGQTLLPFLTKDYEGMDINNTYDWDLVEHLVKHGEATLPLITLQKI